MLSSATHAQWHASNRAAIITCSAQRDEAASEEVNDNGLVFGHEYAVLNLAPKDQFGPGLPPENLIQLQNPWGQGEFTGRFSDQDSANMSKTLREALGR